MSRYVRPHKSATLVRTLTGVVHGGEIDGQSVTLRLWDGIASDGYKTGFAPRPVRWLEFERPFGRWCSRYAGKRWERADADWRRIVAQCSPDGSGRPFVAWEGGAS